MSHRYGTSVHVRLLQVKSKNLLHCKELSCECFVHLNEISIAPVIIQPHNSQLQLHLLMYNSYFICECTRFFNYSIAIKKSTSLPK